MRRVYSVLPCVLLLCALSGCGSHRAVLRSESADSISVIHDTRYAEVVRDTVVHVPIPLESRETEGRRDSSFLQTSVAYSEAVVSADGSLRHTLENKPGPLAVTVPVKEKSTVTVEIGHKNSRTVTEVPAREPLSRREKFFICSGIVLWSAIAVALLVFGVRFFRK